VENISSFKIVVLHDEESWRKTMSETKRYRVVLKDHGPLKISVIKAVREIHQSPEFEFAYTDEHRGLKESLRLVENLPALLVESCTKARAVKVQKRLQSDGAIVSITAQK
jgi:ribosomal protein L7/L12